MKVIVVHEKLFESWAKDFVTFGLLFGGFFLNHRLMGGSWLIDLIIGIFLFIGAMSRAKKQYTPVEAEVALKEMARQETVGSKSKPITSGSTHDRLLRYAVVPAG